MATDSTQTRPLEAEQERALKRALSTLWVRFPGSLEDDYIVYAERRATQLIRRSVYILLAIFLIVVVPVSLLVKDPSLGRWQALGVYPIACSLALLLAAIHVRAVQPLVATLIGLALMISLTGTLIGAIHLQGHFLGQVAAFETVYVLIIGFSILRLPPTRTLFWSLGALIIALGVALYQDWRITPISLLLYYGFPLLVCALNGYMLDASARSNFANMLLRNAESQRLRRWRDNADREARRQRLLNEFTAHIAGNPRVTELLDKTLAFLIENTPAVAGAGYRLEEDGLHLEAARGLGQAAREQSHIESDGFLASALEIQGASVRHEVPGGYMDLETGHSQIRPGEVLFLPIRQGEHTLGILELASLEPFDEHVRSACDAIATPLGYAMIAALGRESFIRRAREKQQQQSMVT
ncbi:GAF domain-containing protein [Alloalcanivorax xenomutans]|uniref:GAF domain-containing protein n=1 Tax=Alloalcanivorax xenomutans TaxID=1094342 RepID=UPI003A80E35C